MNPNTLWSEIFVEALAQAGLSSVCVAPGSRSTPLALAFDRHPDIRVHLHLDERSAAFFALGMALADDAPVALLCTSGTAAANFFPAVIEAYQSHVPLLVLTADRPPELRHSGANQTIDQVKLYGDQVLWSVDVALPEAAAPPVALRNLCTLAARAYATANGQVKGPVHLNFPFRKPLEPEAVGNSQLPMVNYQLLKVQYGRGKLAPTEEQLDHLAQVVDKHERGLIVCGPRCPEEDFPAAVAALSRQSGYPILADPLSGVRFGEQVNQATVAGGHETFFMGEGPGWPEPAVIIRFGAVPTSKWLNTYLEGTAPVHRIHIRENGVWADDSHLVNHFLQADAAVTCRQLVKRIQPRPASSWADLVAQTEARCWAAMQQVLYDDYFDGAVVADVIDNLPPGSLLFAGNSLPVRHVDQFGRPADKHLRVLANRGASGIDGNISTALGAGAAAGMPLVLLVGDITFYHDMNGLLALKNLDLPLTVVLLNNNGGGIFHRLPVSRFEPAFTRLFLTPHGLDFEPAARLYGLEYVRAENRQTFQDAFAASVSSAAPTVIEVRTDGRQDLRRRAEIAQYVLAEIRK